MPYKKTTQIFCPLIEQITNRTNDQREDLQVSGLQYSLPKISQAYP